MVSWSTSRSKALDLFILLVLFILVGLGFYLFLSRDLPADITSGYDDKELEIDPLVEESTKLNLPKPVDFQPVVDNWVGSVSGNRSVLVYDLERDELSANYNASELYNTASLYKLFVVYEGYRKVQSGEWNGEDMVGSTGHNIKKCLDLAIRESNSPCAETLWYKIGHAELDQVVKNDYNITDSNISALFSNVLDIMKMMKLFYEHPDIKDPDLVSQIKDSFLNQPITNYNWRQGLPSGFETANVYNKVGWDYSPAGYWNVYHDAAVVEFPEQNRHFIVVVMTNKVTYQKISELGSLIENAFLNQD